MDASEELAQYKNIRAKVRVHDLLGPGPKLKSPELKLLDYLYEELISASTKDAHMKELLCVHKLFSLSRDCLLTAGPYVFMDARIIDAVGVMLTQMQRKKYGGLRFWYLPTWVQQYIERGDDFGDIWKKLSFYTGPLSECEKIYFPINEDSKHWYLVVVSAPEKSTFYIDTYKYNYERRWSKIAAMNNFVRYMKKSTSGKLGRWAAIDSYWYSAEPADLPDQEALNDGVNCGAYVIHFMLHPKEVSNVTPRTVITAKNRMRLMASLILWEENSVRQTIIECLKIMPMLSGNILQ